MQVGVDDDKRKRINKLLEKAHIWDNLRKGGRLSILVYSVIWFYLGCVLWIDGVQTDLVYLVCIFLSCQGYFVKGGGCIRLHRLSVVFVLMIVSSSQVV